LKEVQAPSTAKAYGSYAELVNDPNVDIIYVATPHSHHFQNAMLVLTAGKHVLCEKALTVNAAQAKKLFETAKEKKVFFMEAVWTRHFPLGIKIRETVTSGEIGKVHRVLSDLSFGEGKEDGSLGYPDENRMVNIDLAGGALLDLGIYALTWVFQILYHCQPKPREAPKVLAAMNMYRTGADEMTSMILQFKNNQSMGIATTNMRVATQPEKEGTYTSGPAVRIQGTKGEIQVYGPIYRPTHYTLIKVGAEKDEVQEFNFPIPTDKEKIGPKGQEAAGWGHGMYWEADEAARCLRDGKLESETLGWEESLVVMEIIDETRRQGGLTYPELIETAIYDPKSPLNGKP
jgi:predicted dehydrogenase